MKKIIFVGILCLTGCVEDDRVICSGSDAGLPDAGLLGDAGDAVCVGEQFIAFPDLLAGTEQ